MGGHADADAARAMSAVAQQSGSVMMYFGAGCFGTGSNVYLGEMAQGKRPQPERALPPPSARAPHHLGMGGHHRDRTFGTDDRHHDSPYRHY